MATVTNRCLDKFGQIEIARSRESCHMICKYRYCGINQTYKGLVRTSVFMLCIIVMFYKQHFWGSKRQKQVELCIAPPALGSSSYRLHRLKTLFDRCLFNGSCIGRCRRGLPPLWNAFALLLLLLLTNSKLCFGITCLQILQRVSLFLSNRQFKLPPLLLPSLFSPCASSPQTWELSSSPPKFPSSDFEKVDFWHVWLGET